MFATERQQVILDRARTAGRVDVTALARELDVTPETIRRDLSSLERRRLVRRTHGGAVPVERPDDRTDGPSEAERIARAALAEIPAEGAVLVDAGPCSTALARLLPRDRELTVVTNALEVVARLADRTDVTVHVLGGRLRAPGRSTGPVTVDDWAERALQEIFVDVAFVSAGGVSVERGLTAPDGAEASVKRAMMASARRTVVLADHTTFRTDAFARFGDLADVDVLISGTALDPALAAAIGRAGPRVVRA